MEYSRLNMVFTFKQERTEKTDYLVGGAYGQLTKAWKDLKEARLQGNEKKIEKLEARIKLLKDHLGLKQ